MAAATRAASRLLVVGLVCCAVAAAAYTSLRLTFGERPVYVNVRWAPGVDDVARVRLEQRYGLTRGEPRERRTWGYALVDRSRDNIRALVMDAAVEDTHQIHRTAFRVGVFAERLPYPTGRPWVPVLLEALSLLALVLGLASLGLAAAERFTPRAVRGPLAWLRTVLLAPGAVARAIVSPPLRWAGARVPSASAEAVAAFRIVFGSLLLVFLFRHRMDATNVDPTSDLLLLEPFRRAPWLADGIMPWLVIWGVLFIAGAAARLSFAMLTAGVLIWAELYTIDVSHHTVSALLLTLVCLLWSPWGDAWSLDARLRRVTTRATPQEYGFTIWAPAFVLGVTFAGAAVAKFIQGGIGWILNGTVKYHFLADSGQALVDWGLRIARHHPIAVLLSFAAIAIESLVIAGVLSRRYAYRAAAGIGALLLLAGFVLFQGVLWPAWWLLLLSFLPWHLVGPEAPAAAMSAGRRRVLYPAIIMLVVASQQAVMSLLRLELSPLLSTYDMYSTTYRSPAEFEEKATDAHWLVAIDDTGRRHQCRITPVEAGALSEANLQVLQRCVPRAVRVKTITVEVTRIRVDWTAWRMEDAARVPLRSFVITD